MEQPTPARGAQLQRTGKILLVFGVVMLATGIYLWTKGTMLAPIIIILGFADLGAGLLLLYKGRPG